MSKKHVFVSSCRKFMSSCLHVKKTCFRVFMSKKTCLHVLRYDVSLQNTGQDLCAIFGVFVYPSIPKISLNHLSNHVRKLPVGLSNRAMPLIL